MFSELNLQLLRSGNARLWRLALKAATKARWNARLLPSSRRLKGYFGVVLALLAIKGVWCWSFTMDADQVLANQSQDLLARRALLVHALREPSAVLDSMPSSLPEQFKGEWAIVSYSMTAMALANMAQLYPETREEAARVVTSLADQVLGEPVRRFDAARWKEDPLETLDDRNGHIGYLGHLNLVLAAEAYLNEKPEHLELFHQVSQALARRIDASHSGLESTYPSETYVPDNAVVIASLGLYYKLFPDQDTGVISRWFAKMEKLRDPTTGLLAFSVDIAGQPLEAGRGSGSAWNVFYLSYANADWAKADFARMKATLYQPLFLGMSGLREYPVGAEGTGDVDSGPVIFGASPAGTGFALAGARLTEDRAYLQEMLRTSEFVGFTWSWSGRRQYLVAPLVGDAIILAMLTTTSWNRPSTWPALRGSAASRSDAGPTMQGYPP